MDELEIKHHGIKGQKWGVRRTLSQLGKPIHNRKIKKQRVVALEKARSAKKEKKEYERNKENTLKKGTAADILKYKGDLTNDQMQNAINRIMLEKRLSELSPKHVKKGKNIIKKINTDILAPAVSDVSRQMAKSGMVYLVNNRILPNINLGDDEYKVFTNNKKK